MSLFSRTTRLRATLFVLGMGLAAFGLVVLFEGCTDVDLRVQRLFFEDEQWAISSAVHARLKGVLYTGPKVLIGLLGGAALVAALASFLPACKPRLVTSASTARLAAWRTSCLLLALAVILGPLLVALCKHYSGIG